MESSQPTLPGWIGSNFISFEESLNGSRTHWLHEQRLSALENLKKHGLPTHKTEEWKYTPLTGLLQTSFALAREGRAEPGDTLSKHALFDAGSSYRVFIVNGKVRLDASSTAAVQDGLTVQTLKEALSTDGYTGNAVREVFRRGVAEDDVVAGLNTAFLHDGIVIVAEKNRQITRPLEIIVYSDGTDSVHHVPRMVVVSREGSELTVVENYIGEGTYLCNPVTSVLVEPQARLEHLRVQRESAQAIHLGSVAAHLENGARFHSHLYSFGSKVSRNEVRPVVAGSDIECRMYGLSVLSDSQHVDNSTLLDHAQPNSQSVELFKGIYGDQSRGVFSGTIIVRQDAQKTNAIQSNQSLLLSDRARIDTRPQLKIWADDVKCTHGATVGQLDEQALFYIRSRGVPKAAARNILIHAFASDVFKEIPSQALRERLEDILLDKLRDIEVSEPE